MPCGRPGGAFLPSTRMLTMKFTLRDVFWLTALAAVACGWYADRRLVAVARTNDRVYFDKTTTMILQNREQIRAENEALKQALQQRPAQPTP